MSDVPTARDQLATSAATWLVLLIPLAFAAWEMRSATGLDGLIVIWATAFTLITASAWRLSEALRGHPAISLRFSAGSMIGSAAALLGFVGALIILGNVLAAVVGYTAFWLTTTLVNRTQR